MDDLARHRVRERDVGADVEPEPACRPTAPRRCAADRRRTAARPSCTPLSRWWKKIGCVSRAFEPQRRMTSVSSISRYDDVPPPAPNTVARPTTLGACQVRLQESMLFVPITWRANFCARKFISFVALEHEKIPNDVDGVGRAGACEAGRDRSSASSQRGGAERLAVANERGRQTALRLRAWQCPFRTRIDVVIVLRAAISVKVIDRRVDRSDLSVLASAILRHLTYLVALARERHFGRAARRLPRLAADALVGDPPARGRGGLPDRAPRANASKG